MRLPHTKYRTLRAQTFVTNLGLTIVREIKNDKLLPTREGAYEILQGSGYVCIRSINVLVVLQLTDLSLNGSHASFQRDSESHDQSVKKTVVSNVC